MKVEKNKVDREIKDVAQDDEKVGVVAVVVDVVVEVLRRRLGGIRGLWGGLGGRMRLGGGSGLEVGREEE